MVTGYYPHSRPNAATCTVLPQYNLKGNSPGCHLEGGCKNRGDRKHSHLLVHSYVAISESEYLRFEKLAKMWIIISNLISN